MKREIKICNECKSKYYLDSSEMMNLCPDCSHYLYEYENCDHIFENGRCVNCYWNGISSEYVLNLKENEI